MNEQMEEPETVTEFADRCKECGAKYGELLKQQPCEDAISRREAIKKFAYNHKGERISDYDCDNFPVQIDIKTVKEILRDLPPVTPQPKVGKWIDIGATHSQCDKCLAVFEIISANGEANFCPNCGAKMESEEV